MINEENKYVGKDHQLSISKRSAGVVAGSVGGGCIAGTGGGGTANEGNWVAAASRAVSSAWAWVSWAKLA